MNSEADSSSCPSQLSSILAFTEGGHRSSTDTLQPTPAPPTCSNHLVVVSVNVTKLTKARLLETLEHAASVRADVIALQRSQG